MCLSCHTFTDLFTVQYNLYGNFRHTETFWDLYVL